MTIKEYNEKKRAEREARAAAYMDAVSVGDIFYSTWGYEQTNVDFYQVTRKTAKTLTLRPISSIKLDEGNMTAREMPARGCFTDRNAHVPIEGKRCRMQGCGSEPSVRICDYANAYPWDGEPVTSTSWY